MTPEQKRRESAADQLAYAAVRLSEGLTAVQTRTARLEDRLAAAAECGVPVTDAEAMTKDLPGIDVAGMIRRAYLDGVYEVEGRDTVVYCTAHRRKCTWLPAPAWWIHDDRLPLTGNLTDPRGCQSLWNYPSPLTFTRKTP